MRKLTAELLTTAYKSKVLKSKLDEDPLQRQIYFLTFIESLDMIFSQYKESGKEVLYYPRIGGGNTNIKLGRQLGIFYRQIFMFIVED